MEGVKLDNYGGSEVM